MDTIHESQFLDSAETIRQSLLDLASMSASWSFCVQRIDFAASHGETWRGLSSHFGKVKQAFVVFEPDVGNNEIVRPLYDSSALQILKHANSAKYQSLFWFELENQCVAVVSSASASEDEFADKFSLGVLTPCDRMSAFGLSITGFLDKCHHASRPPLLRKSASAAPVVPVDSSHFHKQRLKTPAGKVELQVVRSKFEGAHREFAEVDPAKKLAMICRMGQSMPRTGGIISRLRENFTLTARRWDDLSGLYRCPHCIRVILAPRHRQWYDHLWLCLLLRPWQCPHCYNVYLRGIV